MHEKVAKLVIERATVIVNLLARHLTRWSCRASERYNVLARTGPAVWKVRRASGPVLMLRVAPINYKSVVFIIWLMWTHLVNTAITTLQQLGLVFSPIHRSREFVIYATLVFRQLLRHHTRLPGTREWHHGPGRGRIYIVGWALRNGGGLWPSITMGWVGVKFMGKKRYVTHEWPPLHSRKFHCNIPPSARRSTVNCPNFGLERNFERCIN